MKWLTSFICMLFLAAMIAVVPAGCSESNVASDIDASGFEDEGAEADATEMEDEDEDEGEDGGEMDE